jgi:FMN phosphatase YigB (HAD superfamily)
VFRRSDSSFAVSCSRTNARDLFLLPAMIIQVDSDKWRQKLWLRCLQEHDVKGNGRGQRNASSLGRLAHECWSLWSSTRLTNCRMSKGTVNALCFLREETSNIRLGVITNGSAKVQLQKLAACGVASFVDVVFIGDNMEASAKTKQVFIDNDVDACIIEGGCESKLLPGEEKDDGVKATAEKAAAEASTWLELGFPAQRAASSSSSSTTPIFIHRAKPCPSIFQAACAAVGCAPSEAVMVGDSLEMDICGAESAGFAAAVLVTGGKKGEESQQKKADFVQRHHEDGNENRSTTDDDDDGDTSTACCASDVNKNGIDSKTLFLQCRTVSQVPSLLRERRLLF